MIKRPAEIFGYPTDVMNRKAKTARGTCICPFINGTCEKKSRLINNKPMGICSVRYGDQTVIICPKRFLENEKVFKDTATHYFGDYDNLLLFSEAGLPSVGTFDFVIVRHKPLSSEIDDFIIIEIQGNQTTGTGALVKALKDFMRSESFEGHNYEFGLNTYDVLKRSFTQILNKGIVLEKWGQKIYWVLQESVYRNFETRYDLRELSYNGNHSTVFAIYDLKRRKNNYRVELIKYESSTIDNLFSAFRSNPNIPNKDGFIRRLDRKIKANLGLKLRFGT
jgi:hypothetical protein